MPRVVLLHGIATTAGIWDRVARALRGDPAYDVVALERPRTGELAREIAALTPLVHDSWVVGMSGGATLGLALASSGVPLTGAVLHEPAAGSLVPELLQPAAAGFAGSGTAGLASALYGSTWTSDLAGETTDADTAAELAMFRAFEPQPIHPNAGRVTVTYGTGSPPIRAHAVQALSALTGCQAAAIAGVGHFAAHTHPDLFALKLARLIC